MVVHADVGSNNSQSAHSPSSETASSPDLVRRPGITAEHSELGIAESSPQGEDNDNKMVFYGKHCVDESLSTAGGGEEVESWLPRRRVMDFVDGSSDC